ncbi:hypothetical protein [Psychrobacter okhotskensis]|uniref:hypothetical protein n=1 Tax=Psychrobacter okhotskensis TaxID=212403 RepID=UPI003CFEFD87
MGSFYVNITANTPAKEAVSFLKSKGSSAYIMPTKDQQCVIYEQECDTQDIAHMYELLIALTAEQDCSALGVLNHDDDMLFLMLCAKGEFKADYTCGISFEEMYAEYDEESDEQNGEEAEELKAAEKQQQASVMAKALSEAFAVTDIDAILEVLMQDSVFAVETHASLAEVLKLPECSIGLGYNYIEDGQAHDELDMSQLIEVKEVSDE